MDWVALLAFVGKILGALEDWIRSHEFMLLVLYGLWAIYKILMECESRLREVRDLLGEIKARIYPCE